jgi:hypothetical protein
MAQRQNSKGSAQSIAALEEARERKRSKGESEAQPVVLRRVQRQEKVPQGVSEAQPVVLHPVPRSGAEYFRLAADQAKPAADQPVFPVLRHVQRQEKVPQGVPEAQPVVLRPVPRSGAEYFRLAADQAKPAADQPVFPALRRVQRQEKVPHGVPEAQPVVLRRVQRQEKVPQGVPEAQPVFPALRRVQRQEKVPHGVPEAQPVVFSPRRQPGRMRGFPVDILTGNEDIQRRLQEILRIKPLGLRNAVPQLINAIQEKIGKNKDPALVRNAIEAFVKSGLYLAVREYLLSRGAERYASDLSVALGEMAGQPVDSL